MDSKQLVWRCRRGVRELDVLFGRFLESGYPALDDQGKLNFERLLEVQDPQIMDWLFRREEPQDKAMLELINQLREVAGLNN
jgi:antitoxin CptB